MRCVDELDRGAIDPHVYDGYVQLGPPPTADVGEPHVGDPGPHAFVVEVGGARDAIQTHFHRVDQFQYVSGGSGRIGAHELWPGTVHYTDANTPYGPLAPGPEGLRYVTLRGTVDSGAFYMPEARQALKERLADALRPVGSRRQLTLDLLVEGEPGGWLDLVRDEDSLRIAVGTVPEGGELTTPAVEGGGAFLVVVQGAVDHDGARHGEGSLVWLEGGESTTVGSSAGARVGLLQLPEPLPV